MENKVCAKCGKELKDYEVNYRKVDDKAVELCPVCAMAVDYMNSSKADSEPAKEEKKPEPADKKSVPESKSAAAEKKPVQIEAKEADDDKPQPPKKLTKADIDSILVPSESSKSSSSSMLSDLFESNNSISTVLKVASVIILLAGVIASGIFIVSTKEYAIPVSVVCLVSGIVISLLFLALGEIISLLTSISGKMR